MNSSGANSNAVFAMPCQKTWTTFGNFSNDPYSDCADLNGSYGRASERLPSRGHDFLLLMRNSVGDETKVFLVKRLHETGAECDVVGLSLSKIQIDRTIDNLGNKEIKFTRSAFSSAIEDISLRIQDELGLNLFMQIPNEYAKYYSEPRKQFGQEILDKFPSTVTDAESACKGYATGNPTACVFHLMRVMESGLRVLGASLNDPSLNPKLNPSWDTILGRCDRELQKPIAQRSPEWKEDNTFFAQATANLRSVKDAWRNPTMHVEQNYDPDQALAVFNSVRAFMRHLATKLKETP